MKNKHIYILSLSAFNIYRAWAIYIKNRYFFIDNIPKPHTFINLSQQSSVIASLFDIVQILEESQEFNDYLNNAWDLMPSITIDLDYSEDLFENFTSSSDDITDNNLSSMDNSAFLSDPIQDQLNQLRGLWENQGIYDPVAGPELFDSWFDPDIINHTANSPSIINNSKTLSDISFNLFVEGIKMDNLQMVNKSLDASYSIFMQVPDYLLDFTVELSLAYRCTGHEWKDIGSNQPAMVNWRCSGCNSGPHIAILECVHCKIKRCRNCTLKS